MKIVLLSLIFALAQANADFRNCFCFESDGRWCGANQNNDFWRDSCASWVTDALLWTIPAFLMWIVFLFFPVILFSARMCCNCCGGRQPTEGCCCPSQPSLRVFEDGRVEPIPKTYTNRSIFCTKFFFTVVFSMWVYYSVGVYVVNHRVNNAFGDVTGGISRESEAISDSVFSAANATAILITNGATFADQNMYTELQNAQTQYQSVQNDINRIISHLQHVEYDQQWGRYQSSFRIPSIALCVLFPAFIMMLCNCRGAALTIGAGLISWSAVLVVTAFIGHELVAQASTTLCDEYNTTMVPSLINAAQWSGGCGRQSVETAVSNSAFEYFTQACKEGVAMFCDPNVGTFTCPADAFVFLCQDASLIGGGSATGWETLVDLLNETFVNSVTYNDTNCESGCTISMCASSCANGEMQNQAQTLVSFMAAFAEPMTAILNEFYPGYVNCSALYDALQSDDIHGNLCGEFSTQFTNISIQFLALSVTSIAAVIVLVLAAKRFTKMAKVEEVDGQRGSTFAYRVLLQNDEERAVMGSPLLGSNSALPSGYCTASSTTQQPSNPRPETTSGPYGSVQQADNASTVSMCTVAV